MGRDALATGPYSGYDAVVRVVGLVVLDDEGRATIKPPSSVAADLLVPGVHGEPTPFQFKSAASATTGGRRGVSAPPFQSARSPAWALIQEMSRFGPAWRTSPVEEPLLSLGRYGRSSPSLMDYLELATTPSGDSGRRSSLIGQRRSTDTALAALAAIIQDDLAQTQARVRESIRGLLQEHGWEEGSEVLTEAVEETSPHVAHVDRMIEAYAPDIDIPRPVALEQARQNIQLRVALLQEFGAVDAAEVARVAGSKAKNPATTLDNWRRSHRVVVVRYKNRNLVPGFLLTPDGPDPVARPVLQRLAEQGASAWQAALWWVLPKWQLGEQRPVDLLLGVRDADEEASKDVQRRLLEVVDEPRDYF